MPEEQAYQAKLFETSGEYSEPRELEPDERVAISSVIKYVSDVRRPDFGEVTERDLSMITPGYIESGLYVPKGLTDRDVPDAKGPVIFPATEYKLLTKSPEHLAAKAANGVRNKRYQFEDKANVELIAGQASAHALSSQIERTESLRVSLVSKHQNLDFLLGELRNARGTGFFAHYSSAKVRVMVASAETAILQALDVAATTKNWSEEQYERAARTLNYKLFGGHDERYKNWKSFAPMASRYARQRSLVALSARQRLEKEYKKYSHYLEDE